MKLTVLQIWVLEMPEPRSGIGDHVQNARLVHDLTVLMLDA